MIERQVHPKLCERDDLDHLSNVELTKMLFEKVLMDEDGLRAISLMYDREFLLQSLRGS